MILRLLIASLTLFAICGLAAAQEYCIRANRRINLRDAASLQGAWLETVAPGTTLTVIGEQNRWLKINRNGSDVWMASWVDYSRLDNCGGTASQAGPSTEPANIDNCCFVDRQCHTDQDWTEGYFAFQNNQCPAPEQTGSPSPPQPVSGAPAQIDNCCFVDRQCTSELEWASGWHAYRNNQCGAPGQPGASAASQSVSGVILRTVGGIVIGYTGGHSILPSTGPSILPARGQIISRNNCCEFTWQCNNDQDWAAGYKAYQDGQCALPRLVSIVGDPAFVDLYHRSFDLLKNRLPHRHDYVLRGLDKIEQLEGVVTGVPGGSRWFHVRRDGHLDTINSPRVEQVSAALVHEACHVHRFDAGYRVYRCDHEAAIIEEVFCEGMETDVLIELDVEAAWIERQRDLIARIGAGEHIPRNEGC